MFIESALAKKTNRALGPDVAGLYLALLQPMGAGEDRALKAMLKQFALKLTEEVQERPFIDAKLVRRLIETSLRALNHWVDLDGHGRSHLSAALRYLVLEEDGDEDLLSLIGFDDDAKVLNFVLDLLRLPIPPVPLEIPTPRQVIKGNSLRNWPGAHPFRSHTHRVRPPK